MKVKWHEMSADEFEELTAEIMRAEGFENVHVRRGTADGGWDIDALIRVEMPNDRVETQSWGVECKKFQKKPDPFHVRDHYRRMVEAEADTPITHVLLVTSSNFSNPNKKELEAHAKKHRISLYYWEGPDLERLVEKHLESSHIRALVAPYIRVNISLKQLKKACERQVASEISYRVGRKYIPGLYRRRPIENDIREFIESDLEQIQISELAKELKSLKLSKVSPDNEEHWFQLINEIKKAPGWRKVEILLQELYGIIDVNGIQLIKAMVKEIKSLMRNCFLTREKAGSGKTNLLCHLAYNVDNLFPKSPTLALFFSCKFDLHQYHSLESLIIRDLICALEKCDSPQTKSSLAWSAEHLIRTVSLTLQRHNAQLVIFLDGINENRNLSSLDEAIMDILKRWNHYPVKFIVTCRDIFWSYFNEDAWIRFLYQKKFFALPGFALHEIDGIIETYFRHFEIVGKLLETARLKCSHPLLLRFFCEAYRGTKLKEIEDIRLKNLFDEYWKRKCQDIADGLGYGKSNIQRVESFLYNLVDAMSAQYTSQLPVHQLEEVTKETDLDSKKSLYKLFLDEDIIIEELPPEESKYVAHKNYRVSFVYDEFYDYMMALTYIQKHAWDKKDEKALCLDMVNIIEDSASFEQLRGVAEYLVLFAEKGGHHEVLCAVLAKMGCYEILCNVLPKLEYDGEWIEETLLLCLESSYIFSKNNSSEVKAAFNEIRDTITRCEIENLFHYLTKEVIL